MSDPLRTTVVFIGLSVSLALSFVDTGYSKGRATPSEGLSLDDLTRQIQELQKTAGAYTTLIPKTTDESIRKAFITQLTRVRFQGQLLGAAHQILNGLPGPNFARDEAGYAANVVRNTKRRFQTESQFPPDVTLGLDKFLERMDAASKTKALSQRQIIEDLVRTARTILIEPAPSAPEARVRASLVPAASPIPSNPPPPAVTRLQAFSRFLIEEWSLVSAVMGTLTFFVLTLIHRSATKGKSREFKWRLRRGPLLAGSAVSGALLLAHAAGLVDSPRAIVFWRWMFGLPWPAQLLLWGLFGVTLYAIMRLNDRYKPWPVISRSLRHGVWPLAMSYFASRPPGVGRGWFGYIRYERGAENWAVRLDPAYLWVSGELENDETSLHGGRILDLYSGTGAEVATLGKEFDAEPWGVHPSYRCVYQIKAGKSLSTRGILHRFIGKPAKVLPALPAESFSAVILVQKSDVSIILDEQLLRDISRLQPPGGVLLIDVEAASIAPGDLTAQCERAGYEVVIPKFSREQDKTRLHIHAKKPRPTVPAVARVEVDKSVVEVDKSVDELTTISPAFRSYVRMNRENFIRLLSRSYKGAWSNDVHAFVELLPELTELKRNLDKDPVQALDSLAYCRAALPLFRQAGLSAVTCGVLRLSPNARGKAPIPYHAYFVVELPAGKEWIVCLTADKFLIPSSPAGERPAYPEAGIVIIPASAVQSKDSFWMYLKGKTVLRKRIDSRYVFERPEVEMRAVEMARLDALREGWNNSQRTLPPQPEIPLLPAPFAPRLLDRLRRSDLSGAEELLRPLLQCGSREQGDMIRAAHEILDGVFGAFHQQERPTQEAMRDCLRRVCVSLQTGPMGHEASRHPLWENVQRRLGEIEKITGEPASKNTVSPIEAVQQSPHDESAWSAILETFHKEGRYRDAHCAGKFAMRLFPQRIEIRNYVLNSDPQAILDSLRAGDEQLTEAMLWSTLWDVKEEDRTRAETGFLSRVRFIDDKLVKDSSNKAQSLRTAFLCRTHREASLKSESIKVPLRGFVWEAWSDSISSAIEFSRGGRFSEAGESAKIAETLLESLEDLSPQEVGRGLRGTLAVADAVSEANDISQDSGLIEKSRALLKTPLSRVSRYPQFPWKKPELQNALVRYREMTKLSLALDRDQVLETIEDDMAMLSSFLEETLGLQGFVTNKDKGDHFALQLGVANACLAQGDSARSAVWRNRAERFHDQHLNAIHTHLKSLLGLWFPPDRLGMDLATMFFEMVGEGVSSEESRNTFRNLRDSRGALDWLMQGALPDAGVRIPIVRAAIQNGNRSLFLFEEIINSPGTASLTAADGEKIANWIGDRNLDDDILLLRIKALLPPTSVGSIASMVNA